MLLKVFLGNRSDLGFGAHMLHLQLFYLRRMFSDKMTGRDLSVQKLSPPFETSGAQPVINSPCFFLKSLGYSWSREFQQWDLKTGRSCHPLLRTSPQQ
jgi:hypothetical protein